VALIEKLEEEGRMTSNSSIVIFDELTTSDRFRVCWGFVWRWILVSIASALVGAIVGGILGFFLGLIGHFLGWPPDSIETGAIVIGGIGGFTIGLCMLWQYIRWLFRAKLAGYQLRLVRKDAEPGANVDHSTYGAAPA
jgi:hypothetical protein